MMITATQSSGSVMVEMVTPTGPPGPDKAAGQEREVRVPIGQHARA
jgi:hypothetical protein